MGLRFRKSIKVAPGVKLNLGKKSASISVGGKGVHRTYSTTGRKTTSIGIPGTGVYYTTSTSGKRQTSSKNRKTQSTVFTDNENINNPPMMVIPPKPPKGYSITGIILMAIGVIGGLGVIIDGDFVTGLLGGGILILPGIVLVDRAKRKKQEHELLEQQAKTTE